MTDATDRIRAHYHGPGLLARIRTALAAVADEDQPLTPAQLSPLDQFHTRGVLATADLASAAGLQAGEHILDVGCGIGGPARHLAATVGCRVTGVDLSPSFVEAAAYLTGRCRLQDQVRVVEGDALHLPVEPGTFDVVLLQHVAMNIADRAALYAEARRVLRPGGRFATYDLVRGEGEVHYPAPWARDASTSFLLSPEETRAELEGAGFRVVVWRDDAPAAREWLQRLAAAPPPAGLTLGVVMGPDFAAAAANLGRNIREGRLGVLLAVLARD